MSGNDLRPTDVGALARHARTEALVRRGLATLDARGLAQPTRPAQITADLPGGVAMEFVWIEPGTFMIGTHSYEPDHDEDQGPQHRVTITDELLWFEPGFTGGQIRSHRCRPDRDEDEGPQHRVTITKGFYLGKYGITQGQWGAVMGSKPWSGRRMVQADLSSPATFVSWDDVQAFVGNLNQAVGDSLYRLPTEAEWEYACRAGTTTLWSFGDDERRLKDYAWYWANNGGWPQPVGTKLPNPWGLYDMHGNVFEWVQDWYGGYSSDAQTDPRGPAAGYACVVRGGSFFDGPSATRSAFRFGLRPIYGSSFMVGARLLRTR